MSKNTSISSGFHRLSALIGCQNRSVAPAQTGRRVRFEKLQARQLMAADIYIDFGLDWEYDTQTSLWSGTDEISMQGFGLNNNCVPDSIHSFEDGLVRQEVDYNRDGRIDTQDVHDVAAEVLEQVQRLFEPFDVNVHLVSVRNWDEVSSILDSGSDVASYMLVPGTRAGCSGVGQSGGNRSITFGGNYSGSPYGEPEIVGVDIEGLASTIAHEAGHNFGLSHTGERDDLIASGDTMSHFRAIGGGFMRWNLDLSDSGGTQNNYEMLARAVGFRPDSPSYVTGTGAHDVIKIGEKEAREGSIHVSVTAYADAEHTQELKSIEYSVFSKNGILVDGLQGNDKIEVFAGVGETILRGGYGDDVIIGGEAADSLEGGPGNDTLAGGEGGDTYVFTTPAFSFWADTTLGNDTLVETAKGIDTLDFSGMDSGVTVSLGTSQVQKVSSGLKITLYDHTLFENIVGSEFADTLNGNDRDNMIWAGGGNDIVRGYGGSDELFGQLGRDTLDGGKGSDLLDGGLDGEKDTLIGGSDRDLFVMGEPEKAKDYVPAYDSIYEAMAEEDEDPREADSQPPTSLTG